jgi:hypothetical protein
MSQRPTLPEQIFILHLRATPACPDAIRCLRQLLKIALRRFGLRCVSIEQVKQ